MVNGDEFVLNGLVVLLESLVDKHLELSAYRSFISFKLTKADLVFVSLSILVQSSCDFNQLFFELDNAWVELFDFFKLVEQLCESSLGFLLLLI